MDDRNKERQRRSHTFCRYADDCNIYERSEVAAQRVPASLTRFLDAKLERRVNRGKSAVARVEDRIWGIARRNRGIGPDRRLRERNAFLGGWATYFRRAAMRSRAAERDGEIRRKENAGRSVEAA